jgi:hypothetical protein
VYFQGNAPSVLQDSGDSIPGSADNTVFYNSGSGTAYYVPGTTGWGVTFGGWPTALWNPQVQTAANRNFGIRTNRFGFDLTGTTNIPVVVEASTNLQEWTPLFSGSLTNGSVYFADSQWTNYPQRFYRVRSP